MDFGGPVRLASSTGAIVFNGFAFSGADPASGFSGPGFVAPYFRLTEIAGMDMPSLRTTADDRPQRDGAILYDSFLGARYPTLRGLIVPAEGSEAEMIRSRQEMQEELARVMLGLLREDGELRWAPYGVISGTPEPAEKDRVLTVRAWEPLQVSGGVRKDFHVGLVAAGPYAVCVEHTMYEDTGSPFSVEVENHGTAPARDVIRVYGSATPVTAVDVRNAETGKLVRLEDLALGASDYAEIDMGRESVVAGTTGAGSTPQLTNPGFETNTAGWTATSGTLTRDTSVADAGTASGRVTTGATGFYFIDTNSYTGDLTVGQRYRLTVSLRRTASLTKIVSLGIGGASVLIDASDIPIGSFDSFSVEFTAASLKPTIRVLNPTGNAEPSATDVLYLDEVLITSLAPVNLIGKVDEAVSEFWEIAPGDPAPNTATVELANVTGTPSKLEVVHHDAWLA